MTTMGTKTIAFGNKSSFDEAVARFLKKYEELVFHDKTVFAITQGTFRSKPVTMYSAIFYGELGSMQEHLIKDFNNDQT